MASMRRNVKNRIKQAGVLLGSTGLILLFYTSAYAIARGYTSNDRGLQTGMVVSLSVDGSSDSNVERATQDTSNKVVGIVTTLDNSLVTVSSGSAKVLVESEGQTDAYVSDLNGEITQGDQLVISPLKGILMKASGESSTIIALAADTPSTASSYTYQDATGKKETQIAKVRVNLNRQGGGNAATLPSDSALAKLGRSIVGKDVGETRVLIALILFVIVLIAEGGIIYGAISSSITALGRNPLARKIIRNELIRVVGIAVIVLFVGLGAVYAVLWV